MHDATQYPCNTSMPCSTRRRQNRYIQKTTSGGGASQQVAVCMVANSMQNQKMTGRQGNA
eukprot:1157525-Pelagomonas_calceolata.AAC.4